jgi:hypothetical protein
MRKYVFFSFLFVMACLQATDVFAITCTQNGDTTYCTDTSTGQTTTYNQYGDNIYGSDGSSWTIYNSPFSGGGSGYSVPSLSGVDTDSPEYKAALARHKEACGNNKGASGEVLIGGTQATECREAYIAWLDTLNSSKSSNQSDTDDDYSDYSNSNDENSDEWTKKLLSDFGISNNSSQSASCVPNSHIEGGECACDNGYINNFKGSCVPLSNQSCVGVFGEGVEANYNINSCVCKTGYSAKSSVVGCVPDSATTNNSTARPSSIGQSEEIVANILANFEVKPEDILPLNETGKINTEATLRVCPSTQCSKVLSYPEGTVVEIVGKYKNDTWYKVNVINSKSGWMHQSLLDEVIKQDNLEDGTTSEPIRITREEYEAKYGVPVPNEFGIKTEEIETEKVSWWKKILNWFGF